MHDITVLCQVFLPPGGALAHIIYVDWLCCNVESVSLSPESFSGVPNADNLTNRRQGTAAVFDVFFINAVGFSAYCMRVVLTALKTRQVEHQMALRNSQ